MIDPFFGVLRRWRPRLLVSLAGLVLLPLFTACGGAAAIATPCPDENYPALELAVVGEADEPLMGVSMRYRLDDGPWQEWPENLGRNTVIRGRPGLYEVEIAREGYGSAATTVAVAGDGEASCQPLLETVELQLARTPCPEPPAELMLGVEPPLSGLEARLTLPETGQQQLACADMAGDDCRAFSFTAAELGDYFIEVTGLPGLGPMQVVSDVVVYDPQPVRLGLEHRGLAATAEASGAEVVTLRFPVERDEANCPLADLRAVETTLKDDRTGAIDEQAGRPPLALRYLGSLTMTDLGADPCQAEPSLTPLPFGVELPAGTDVNSVQVQVEYGEGWRTAACALEDGRYVCRVQVPNPLLDRPFVARVQAGQEAATGLSLPFSGMCLIFE